MVFFPESPRYSEGKKQTHLQEGPSQERTRQTVKPKVVVSIFLKMERRNMNIKIVRRYHGLYQRLHGHYQLNLW